MSEFNNICIVGIGGVGGFFGGTMAVSSDRPGSGKKNVTFIARGENLEAIRRSGLILNTGGRKDVVCRPTLATNDMTVAPISDLCLICVKSYDLENAVRSLKGAIRKDTVIIPLLNGVNICERIRAILDDGMILPACVYVETRLERPGVVTQKGGDGIIRLGPDPRSPDYDPSDLLKALDDMGVKVKWNADPYPEIWEKFIFIAGYGLVTTCSGKTIGEVAADPELRETVRSIMIEIKAIADKKHIALPDDIVERSVLKAGNFSFEAKTSYQRDVEAKGRRNEGDIFGKSIVEMGKQAGVQTPVTTGVFDRISKNR